MFFKLPERGSIFFNNIIEYNKLERIKDFQVSNLRNFLTKKRRTAEQFCSPRSCLTETGIEREKGKRGGRGSRQRKNRREEMSDALINGLAGAGGGIIAQLLTYPLQTVNTRQQTERDPSKCTRTDGTLRLMYQVMKNEGWERLYGGLTPSLVGTAASQGVYYYFYQIFRDRAESAALAHFKKGTGDGSVGILQSLLVAALAGCVNVLLTNPIWVVVARMQTHKKTRKETTAVDGLPAVLHPVPQPALVENSPYKTSQVVHELYNEAGFFGFWKGVVPTLIMVSNPAIQFMLYETLLKNLKKKRATNLKGADGLSALEIFFLGALAKLGATIATYPFLVVKARLQVGPKAENDKRRQYKGTLDAIRKMIKYEGAWVLYKGMSTKIVQSVFAAAVLFMVKEELVKAAHLVVTGGLSLGLVQPSKPKPSHLSR